MTSISPNKKDKGSLTKQNKTFDKIKTCGKKNDIIEDFDDEFLKIKNQLQW